jgi:hypothetical protein
MLIVLLNIVTIIGYLVWWKSFGIPHKPIKINSLTFLNYNNYFAIVNGHAKKFPNIKEFDRDSYKFDSK